MKRCSSCKIWFKEDLDEAPAAVIDVVLEGATSEQRNVPRGTNFTILVILESYLPNAGNIYLFWVVSKILSGPLYPDPDVRWRIAMEKRFGTWASYADVELVTWGYFKNLFSTKPRIKWWQSSELEKLHFS